LQSDFCKKKLFAKVLHERKPDFQLVPFSDSNNYVESVKTLKAKTSDRKQFRSALVLFQVISELYMEQVSWKVSKNE